MGDENMGRMLITLGLLLVVAGLVIEFGSNLFPLGHLPGDIHITGKPILPGNMEVFIFRWSPALWSV